MRRLWRRAPDDEQAHREQIDEAAKQLREQIRERERQERAPQPPPPQARIPIGPTDAASVIADTVAAMERQRTEYARRQAVNGLRQSQQHYVDPSFATEDAELRARRLAKLEEDRREQQAMAEEDRAEQWREREEAARLHFRSLGLPADRVEAAVKRLHEIELDELVTQGAPTPPQYRRMVD